MQGENTPDKNYQKHIKDVHGLENATLPDVTYEGLTQRIEKLREVELNSPVSRRHHEMLKVDPFGALTEVEAESELYRTIEKAANYISLPLPEKVNEGHLVRLIQTAIYLRKSVKKYIERHTSTSASKWKTTNPWRTVN